MLARLPPEFADLEQFAHFAVSDDLDRGLATDAAAEQNKRAFVDAIWPRTDEINSYLDEDDDKAGCNLGDLAQAAAEISIDLKYRPNE